MIHNNLHKILLLAGIMTLPSSYLHAEEVTDYSGLIGARDYQEGVVLANDVTVPENTQQVYIQYEGNGSLSSKGDNVYTINGNNVQTYIHVMGPDNGGEMNFNLSNIKFTNFAHHEKGILNISGVNANLDNVTFDTVKGGSQTQFWGGMLNIEGGSTVAIKNSLFQNADIVSTSGSGDGASGGVINIQGQLNDTHQSQITAIENSRFLNNTVNVNGGGANAYGGVIANEGLIGTISGSTFSGNKLNVQNELRAQGGVIANGSANDDERGTSRIEEIADSTFADNSITSVNGNATGGAIWNESGNFIGTITDSVFTGNSVSSTGSGSAYGGAVYNDGTIEKIINSTFTDNNAGTFGGAIYSTKNLTLAAENGNTEFSGNTDGSGANDIYMAGNAAAPLSLNLQTDNGKISFAGGINGKEYNIALNGTDTAGTNDNDGVYFNGVVNGANNITLNDGAKLWLGINGEINVNNLTATGSAAFLKVDVEVDTAANNVSAGIINVANDLSGAYNVIVNPLNVERLQNDADSMVAFLSAPNDDTSTASSVKVARVVGSTNMWKAVLNAGEQDKGSVWYLSQTDEEPSPTPTPTPQPTPYAREKAPEIVAAGGLASAAVEQTRDLLRIVSGKAASTRSYYADCGIYPDAWDGKKLNNGWIVVGGKTADIDAPFAADADIWSVEAGFDLQADAHNTFGLFASYRQGEYDFSGKGDRYFASTGSDIDIDSYLGGLYYRYDKNAWWLFASVYGGIQEADASTDDGLASFDTDGTEFGAGIEGGKTFAFDSWTLTPSVGIYYTETDFDNANDNLAKKYSWDKVRHMEAEAAVRVEKTFVLDESVAGLYVKPAVIQTIEGDNAARVIGALDATETDGADDATLGRIEIGGRYGFTTNLSAYGWANYTFGSDYDATAFGLGLNYAF